MAESIPPSPGPPRVSPWHRLGPVLIAAAVYLVFIANPGLWNAVIWPHAMAHHGLPFVDMQGHLASSRAFADGQLVTGGIVPGDPVQRIHGGPTWMLWLGYLGLGPASFLPFTAGCIAAFLATLALVLRPRNFAESAFLLAGLLAPPLMLLIERGNIDLFVFVALAGAFALLAKAAARARWAGWGLIAAFIGFKYYPALAFAGLTESRGTRREKITALVLGLLAVGLFIGWNMREIGYVSGHQVENRFFPFFGARELPLMAGYTPGPALWIGLATWTLATAALARLLGPLTPAESGHDPRKIGFTGGGAILTFCFLVTSSPDYRLVFFLFCLPWLWSLRRRETGEPALRRLATLCLALFLVVPWWGTLVARVAVALDSTLLWWTVLIAKQLGWWLLMVGLGALLLRLFVVSGFAFLGRPRP